MQESNIITISATDTLYPEIFMQLTRPPSMIYAQGNLTLLQSKHILGIVGTRRATGYGREVTIDLSRKLAANGAVILSGLAHGIDSIAHQAALDAGGSTIAVLPSGLSNIYPASHTGLAHQILRRNGLLLSEYEPSMWPAKYHFVERNRLIAALSNVVLITEAAYKSGTFHTVKFAQKLNKTIAVVPGNINNPMSKGVNKLFFEGAQPILESADLFPLLGLNEKIIKPSYKAVNHFESAIVALLQREPRSSEQLVIHSNLDVSTINIHLTILEIKGVIEQVSGSKWKLT